MSKNLVIAAAMAAAMLSTTALAQSGGTSGSVSTSGVGGASAPGTNSAGTPQSSGMTTGTGSGALESGKLGTGRTVEGPDSDIGLNPDNRSVDRKIKSICKGC